MGLVVRAVAGVGLVVYRNGTVGTHAQAEQQLLEIGTVILAVTLFELEPTGSFSWIRPVGLYRRRVVVYTAEIEIEGPAKGQNQCGHQRGPVCLIEPIQRPCKAIVGEALRCQSLIADHASINRTHPLWQLVERVLAKGQVVNQQHQCIDHRDLIIAMGLNRIIKQRTQTHACRDPMDQWQGTNMMADQCASHQAHHRDNRNGFCGAFQEKQPHPAPTLRLHPARRITRNTRMKLHKQKARQTVCYAHFQQMSSPQIPIVLRLHFPAWRAVINQEPVSSATRKDRRQRRIVRSQATELLRMRRPLGFCAAVGAFRNHHATRLPKTTI